MEGREREAGGGGREGGRESARVTREDKRDWGAGTLVMHETHYFYLEQAESGAELQSIFCLSFSAPLIAHPLLILRPPSLILSAVHSQFHSFWFRSELIRGWPGPCFVRSYARSFVQDGWLALPRATGICIPNPTICISIPRDSRHRAPLPPPLPNGGYKHKYEFKGPQMTVSRITSPTILCILIRSPSRPATRYLPYPDFPIL